jgi:hypothetical protein
MLIGPIIFLTCRTSILSIIGLKNKKIEKPNIGFASRTPIKMRPSSNAIKTYISIEFQALDCQQQNELDFRIF